MTTLGSSRPVPDTPRPLPGAPRRLVPALPPATPTPPPGGAAPARPGVPWTLPAKYQLLRVLGMGGMGTVLLARDRNLGRLVAIKVLHESCPDFLRRFRREARVMARLEHRSIVRVFDLDEHDGHTYLVMEYVDGGSLAQARLEPRPLLEALRDVIDALGHAHAHGVVHRDVKPQNVLLDRGGRAVLTDFGLALDPDEGTARDGVRPVVGTPLTMSPEQARGEGVGPASDVFSLGVTLYRQLTGEWPFRGRRVSDVLTAIRRRDPLSPRALCPDLPRELEQLVLDMLAKDPRQRVASMDALGERVDRLLGPCSWLRRARTWIARRRQGAGDRTGPRIHPGEL